MRCVMHFAHKITFHLIERRNIDGKIYQKRKNENNVSLLLLVVVDDDDFDVQKYIYFFSLSLFLFFVLFFLVVCFMCQKFVVSL